MSFTRDNHYVPRLYLKQFASDDGHLFRYRTLVSKPSVPMWKRMNIAGVAYQSNLYTRSLADGDSDEIEKWLNTDFESPASESINKVVSDERLSREDYRLLVRFLAAQMVRTPAFLIENLPRWREEVQRILDASGERLKSYLEHGPYPAQEQGQEPVGSGYFPFRVTQEKSADGKSVVIKTQTIVGRGTWIAAMRHILTNTISRLTTHKWTILSAEDDLPWFTSDDPVVRLNFRSPQDYDFKGGWAVPKTNFIMPLSPKHLFYTQVGERSPPRGTILPREKAVLLRKIIAEHAHRYIFSLTEDPQVPGFRPRHVDAQAVINEDQEWRRWHEQQSAAERALLLKQ